MTSQIDYTLAVPLRHHSFAMDTNRDEPAIQLSRRERDLFISRILAWLLNIEEKQKEDEKEGGQSVSDIRHSPEYRAIFEGVFHMLSQNMQEDIRGRLNKE